MDYVFETIDVAQPSTFALEYVNYLPDLHLGPASRFVASGILLPEMLSESCHTAACA